MEDTYRNFYDYIGTRIMEIRVGYHYTREYLAEMADISAKFLYEIETGKKGCSSYVLYRIAKALNVNISHILVDNPDKIMFEINPAFTYLSIEYKEIVNRIIQIMYERTKC